jgi:hypothetical protein
MKRCGELVKAPPPMTVFVTWDGRPETANATSNATALDYQPSFVFHNRIRIRINSYTVPAYNIYGYAGTALPLRWSGRLIIHVSAHNCQQLEGLAPLRQLSRVPQTLYCLLRTQ